MKEILFRCTLLEFIPSLFQLKDLSHAWKTIGWDNKVCALFSNEPPKPRVYSSSNQMSFQREGSSMCQLLQYWCFGGVP